MKYYFVIAENGTEHWVKAERVEIDTVRTALEYAYTFWDANNEVVAQFFDPLGFITQEAGSWKEGKKP